MDLPGEIRIRLSRPEVAERTCAFFQVDFDWKARHLIEPRVLKMLRTIHSNSVVL